MSRPHGDRPEQFTLAIDRPHEQRLDNFVVGANDELFANLAKIRREFKGLWLYGDAGSGRSHLLRGRCLAAQLAGEPACYVGCAELKRQPGALAAALAHAAEFGRIVAIDDVGHVAGDVLCEEYLMAAYQRLLGAEGELLISHDEAAPNLAFTLPDLNSRLRSLMNFLIQPLRDADKAELLRRRANSRGYALTQGVIDYWLARGPRDVGALLTDLELLDRASLANQRVVTVPLLKQVLGY